MKTIICLILLLSGYLSSYSQTKYYKPQIALGVTGRGSPRYHYSSTVANYYPFYYSLFVNARPVIFSLDIKVKFFKEKLIAQLSNNITYGLLKRGTGPYGDYFSDNSLRRDHFIDLLYTIPIKPKFPKILIGVGYGVMNAGTKFMYSKPYNGNPANNNIPGTLRFYAPRVLVGLEKGVFNVYLIANYTGRDEYYNKTPAYNLEGKLTVTFPKFKKLTWKSK
jgi:hypothetical protein